LPYDVLKDLAGVAPLVSLPSVLIVPQSLGVKEREGAGRESEGQAGEFNYGTAGVGSAAHINSEKFNKASRHQGRARAAQGHTTDPLRDDGRRLQ